MYIKSFFTNGNPNVTRTLQDISTIEIQAMVVGGLPQNVAQGWVTKTLEGLIIQGVTNINRIP